MSDEQNDLESVRGSLESAAARTRAAHSTCMKQGAGPTCALLGAAAGLIDQALALSGQAPAPVSSPAGVPARPTEPSPMASAASGASSSVTTPSLSRPDERVEGDAVE